MLSSHQEKRLYPRLKLGLPLRYQARGTQEFRNALSDNLSIGGISFTALSYIAPSTNLMLEINLLSRALNPVARVAWAVPIAHSDKYKLGLEFVEFNPRDREYVGDFIDTHLKRF
ncbi:MAG: PilZ domain-containing protein [Candidatus Omnitrophica bacterium]|nr:PilZ domain-containing protein [Candidatus Omnitrophota bacterium]